MPTSCKILCRSIKVGDGRLRASAATEAPGWPSFVPEWWAREKWESKDSKGLRAQTVISASSAAKGLFGQERRFFDDMAGFRFGLMPTCLCPQLARFCPSRPAVAWIERGEIFIGRISGEPIK